MPVVGVGTDLVSVIRFQRLIDRGGYRFLNRWFTPSEVAYCLSKEHPARHAAARFAAKEAVLKALQVRTVDPPPWREIEIRRDGAGRPGVRLHGTIHRLATAAGVGELRISLAHEVDYATATAIALAPEVQSSVR